MTELNSKIMTDDIKCISSPNLINILRTIKAIQKRMKDPEIKNLEFIQMYDKLGKEFEDFFNKHTKIFTMVIKGENLRILASVLYYKDKIEKGLMTEQQLSEMLAEKYLPSHLKAEADARIKEMRIKGEI